MNMKALPQLSEALRKFADALDAMADGDGSQSAKETRPEFVDPHDFAQQEGVSYETVLRWCGQGMPHERHGPGRGRIRIRPTAAMDWRRKGGTNYEVHRLALVGASKGYA